MITVQGLNSLIASSYELKKQREEEIKSQYKVECPYCYDTGIHAIPDGPDDFERNFCECPVGMHLARENAKQNGTTL